MLLKIFTLLLIGNSAWAALDANTVANINGRNLSKLEFDRRYKENLRNFKYVAPSKQSVLNDIINFELAVQEAKNQQLDKNAEVQERINTVLYQALVEQTLSEKFKKAVDVSDQDARDYCRHNPEIRTSHIYVPLKLTSLKADEEAAYKKIREAQAALQQGKKFEDVVKNYSDGFATGTGGDIGFQTKDKLDPTYYREALRLSVGGMTKEIVRSQYGLHIIKLTEKKDCAKINVADFKRMVYDEKRSKIFEDFMSSLRSKAKIAINESLVKE